MENKKWTEKEIKFLKENHKNLKYKEISNIINRTPGAIENKCMHLNLKKIKIPLSELQKQFTHNIAYILGVCLGDACIYPYCIKLEVIDEEFALEFKKALDDWSRMKAVLTLQKSKGVNRKPTYRVMFYSSQAIKFLKNFMDNRLNEILIGDKEIQASFLRGLYDSEGCVMIKNKKYCCLQFTNTNLKIINICEKLLKKFKIKFTRTKYVWNNHYKIRYDVRIYKIKSAKIFLNKIGFSIKRKQEKLKQIVNNYEPNPYFWSKEEEFFLRKNYKIMFYKDIGEKIGKSEGAIEHKLRYLNLYKKWVGKQKLTQNQEAIIKLLRMNGSMKLSEIAKERNIDLPNIWQSLNYLKHHKIIEKIEKGLYNLNEN